jgi:hypothetical protein
VHQLFIDFKKAYVSAMKEVLYILIEAGIHKKLVRLIKMCLNETYGIVRVGQHLSDTFLIKNYLKEGDALSSLFFSCALECANWRVQVNQDALKLNGTYQFLVYADNCNILGGSLHTIKKNKEALVVASKKSGLKINVDKTKYMVMFRDQYAERSHKLKIDNSSFERVGTTLMNQNSIQKKIKSRLKSGNVCYHSVQNLLSSSLLSKTLKTNIYRTIIFPVAVYGCGTWSLTLREEHRLRVFANRVLKRKFGP